MVQMKLWNHDCEHKYVFMPKRKPGEPIRMVCGICGSDVDHKSILRDAVKRAKAGVNG